MVCKLSSAHFDSISRTLHCKVHSGKPEKRGGTLAIWLSVRLLSRCVQSKISPVSPAPKKPGPFRRTTGATGARARVLAQWRGVDVSAAEKAQAVAARSVSDLVPSVLTELRIDARQGDAEIVRVWNSVIDPNLTAHAQPANLNKGTLFVTVDSSVWLSEIVRYRRKEILDRMQNSFGKTRIQKISYRIG